MLSPPGHHPSFSHKYPPPPLSDTTTSTIPTCRRRRALCPSCFTVYRCRRFPVLLLESKKISQYVRMTYDGGSWPPPPAHWHISPSFNWLPQGWVLRDFPHWRLLLRSFKIIHISSSSHLILVLFVRVLRQRPRRAVNATQRHTILSCSHRAPAIFHHPSCMHPPSSLSHNYISRLATRRGLLPASVQSAYLYRPHSHPSRLCTYLQYSIEITHTVSQSNRTRTANREPVDKSDPEANFLSSRLVPSWPW